MAGSAALSGACRRLSLPLVVMAVTLGTVLLLPVAGWGETPATGPLLSIDLNRSADTGGTSVVLQIFLLLTVLSIAPAILIMLTSFTRIAIVLSVLRRAIGTQTMPPNQVVLGLSLFLTFFIMSPVWESVNQNALQPYLVKQITQQQAFEKALAPIRAFMVPPAKHDGQ